MSFRDKHRERARKKHTKTRKAPTCERCGWTLSEITQRETVKEYCPKCISMTQSDVSTGPLTEYWKK